MAAQTCIYGRSERMEIIDADYRHASLNDGVEQHGELIRIVLTERDCPVVGRIFDQHEVRAFSAELGIKADSRVASGGATNSSVEVCNIRFWPAVS